MDTMDRAILINTLEGLPYLKDDHARLYFGVEFCERLIPSSNDVLEAFEKALSTGKKVTLVTPYVFEKGLDKLEKLLDDIEAHHTGIEVIFNDWGVLELLKDRFKPVLGRLLNRQARGPRILEHMKLLNPEDELHYKKSVADHGFFSQFISGQGVVRVELDNLLHGIDHQSPLPASLYVPFGYVTTTRFCLAVLHERLKIPEDKVLLRQLLPCSRECMDQEFQISSERLPVPLYIRGTSEFYRNEHLPENLNELNIDRIVVEPEVPR